MPAQLVSPIGRRKWDELLAIVEPQLTPLATGNLLDAVRGFIGEPHQRRELDPRERSQRHLRPETYSDQVPRSIHPPSWR